MNLKEYAVKNGISLAEAKAETGLTHWKQEVVECAIAEHKEEVDLELVELSIRSLGNKSPHWDKRHMLEV